MIIFWKNEQVVMKCLCHFLKQRHGDRTCDTFTSATGDPIVGQFQRRGDGRWRWRCVTRLAQRLRLERHGPGRCVQRHLLERRQCHFHQFDIGCARCAHFGHYCRWVLPFICPRLIGRPPCCCPLPLKPIELIELN